MLSADQLLNEGRYSPVTPSSATETPNEEATSVDDLSKFVGPGSERPDVADVLAWTGQLLEALHALHTKAPPIIHSGIEPAAVKILADGTVQLKTMREAGPSGAADPLANYKPLEQLWDSLDQFSQQAILNRYDDEAQRWLTQPLVPASDIYSVGATIYAVLTGTPPPDALDRSIAAMEDKKDPLVPPHELVRSIPPEISDVVVKAMALNRDERYYSAVILRQVFKTAAVRVRERLSAAVPDAARNTASPAAEPVRTVPVPEPVADIAPIVEVSPVVAHVEAKSSEVLPLLETPLNDVLEVPAVPVIQQKPVVEVPAEEVLRTEPHLEQVEPPRSEPDLEEEPAFLGALAEDDRPRRSKTAIYAAAFVVLLLAAGGGIYKFASAGPASPPAAETTVQPIQAVNPPQPETQPSPLPPTVEQAAETLPATDVPAGAPDRIDPRVRQTKISATAVQAEPAKKAPTPAKPQNKKQVTVDDLINDDH